MKNLFLLAALLCSLSAFSQTADEAAVKSLLAKETETYYARDQEGWASCWAHENYIRWNTNSGMGYFQLDGWEALNKEFQAVFNDTSASVWKGSVEQKDWSLRVSGNLAFANYKQFVKASSNAALYVTCETRTCEKQGGGWKIIGLTSLGEQVNYSWLYQTLFDLYLAMDKGETPESFASANTELEKKTFGMEPIPADDLAGRVTWFYGQFKLGAETLQGAGDPVQIRRTHLGKSKELASFFQVGWSKGTTDQAERYFRAYWKTQGEAYGYSYEAKDEGDQVTEIFRKK